MISNKPEDLPTPNHLRRKLFKGLPAGVGVIMAVQAKTALGTAICQSPSAMMSGNTSPRSGGPTSCSGGRSPGFWKVPQKFTYWTGAQYATFKPGVNVNFCSSGMQGLSMSDILNEGTLLASVFSGAPSVHGLWAVLAFPTHSDFAGKGQLLRHLSAAYLNSKYPSWSGGKYPITTAQVVDMWVQLSTKGYYSPTAGATSGMSANDVIAYISGMYDIAADIPADGSLCKT
jgi:hypothetical protein